MSTSWLKDLTDLDVKLISLIDKFNGLVRPSQALLGGNVNRDSVKDFLVFSLALMKLSPELRNKLTVGQDLTDYINKKRISDEKMNELISMFETLEENVEYIQGIAKKEEGRSQCAQR